MAHNLSWTSKWPSPLGRPRRIAKHDGETGRALVRVAHEKCGPRLLLQASFLVAGRHDATALAVIKIHILPGAPRPLRAARPDNFFSALHHSCHRVVQALLTAAAPLTAAVCFGCRCLLAGEVANDGQQQRAAAGRSAHQPATRGQLRKQHGAALQQPSSSRQLLPVATLQPCARAHQLSARLGALKTGGLVERVRVLCVRAVARGVVDDAWATGQSLHICIRSISLSIPTMSK